MWVASAGFGLVPLDGTGLKPYAATFTPGHADSVTPTGRRTSAGLTMQAWWSHLSRTNRASRPHLLDLLDRNAFLVVVASPWYLLAMETDLLEMARAVGEDRITIVSLGNPTSSRVAHLTARVTASIEHHPSVGGTRSALNARAALLAFHELAGRDPTRSAINAVLAKATESLPAPRTWNRRTHTDDEIIKWIEDSLAETPHASRSGLLKRFRADQRACEQQRFAELFERAATPTQELAQG
jgi:hypothetical protein